ncbi:helix-turn-helix domain-containing protein [Bacillus sp. 105MF]|uniref:helix-turn-helix domain-containing protein n=1 Tax=Bacillus sp. 105MF TaxID=1151120 RepID=UPI00036D7FB1|nr:helix-turn-helix domain-containing protein [Bacillus sp. 105MF]
MQNKTINDYPLVLTAVHVSEILGISKRVAYEIMEYKDFPLVRVGRQKRVGRDAFFNWLESRSQQAI